MTLYCTLASLKAMMEITDNAFDDLLIDYIETSSREIDKMCQRHFYPRYETRRFDLVRFPMRRAAMRELYFDADLHQLTQLVNGDGQPVPLSAIEMFPRNDPPYFGLSLKRSSGNVFLYNVNAEAVIHVTGTWGFLDTLGSTPAPIRLAAMRLAHWRFKQRLAPFEKIGLSEGGMLSVPTALPADVERMLMPYVRVTFAGA